jgi:hypothetical protein
LVSLVLSIGLFLEVNWTREGTWGLPDTLLGGLADTREGGLIWSILLLIACLILVRVDNALFVLSIIPEIKPQKSPPSVEWLLPLGSVCKLLLSAFSSGASSSISGKSSAAWAAWPKINLLWINTKNCYRRIETNNTDERYW